MARIGSKAEKMARAVLAQTSGLSYFRVDADRNVVEMSPAMERLTGFRARDMVGRSCLEIHRCEECLRGCGVFDNHRVVEKKLELYRADGSIVRVSKSGRLFFDDEGEVIGALEIVRPLDGRSSERTIVGSAPQASADASEADRIRAALEAARYRRTQAARALGMSRTTLWRKMNEYGI